MRALRIVRTQLRLSVLLALQYRWEMALDALLSIFWTGTALLPLWLVFEARETIAGQRFHDALGVLGVFTMLQGILEGAIHPSLATVVEQVRKGTLDFTLLKPADAQLLVSTSRFAPFRILNVLAGLALVVTSRLADATPITARELGAALVLLGGAVAILYSLTILTVAASFYAVRVDGLRHLFSAIFDAARWPATVYEGPLRVAFTYVLPLAVMTSYPAWALGGHLETVDLVRGLIIAFMFTWVSRRVFIRSLGRYTSAS